LFKIKAKRGTYRIPILELCEPFSHADLAAL